MELMPVGSGDLLAILIHFLGVIGAA